MTVLQVGARLSADGSQFIAQVNAGKQALSGLGAAGKQAQAGLSAADQSVDALGRRLGQLRNAAGAIGVGLGAGALAQGYVQAADAMTSMSARLDLVTGSAARTADVQGKLFDIAQSSRVSFTGLADTYAQISRSAGQFGATQSQLLTVTQALSQAITISGGSAQAAQAAMVQLSQGLAAGTLRGEELNSILEQTPRVAQAIADGMGVSIGQLRKLGEEGSLTSRAVIDALQKSAPQIAAEFAKIKPTVAGAFQVFKNSATDFVGEVDRSSGASRALADALTGLASTLSEAKDGVSGFVEVAKPIAEMAVWAAGGMALARSLQAIAAVGVGSGMMAVLARMGGALGGPVGIAGALAGGVISAATSEDADITTLKAQENAALQRTGGRVTGEVQYLRDRQNELRTARGKAPIDQFGLPALSGYNESTAADTDSLSNARPLAAAQRAADAYVSDKENMSKAAIAARERLTAVQKYKEVVDDLVAAGASEVEVAKAREALMQRLANIEAKSGGTVSASDARQAAGARLADRLAAIQAEEKAREAVLDSASRRSLKSEEDIARERAQIQRDSIDEQIAAQQVALGAAGKDLSERAKISGDINKLSRERASVEQALTLQLEELASRRTKAAEAEASAVAVAMQRITETRAESVSQRREAIIVDQVRRLTGGSDEAIRLVREIEQLETARDNAVQGNPGLGFEQLEGTAVAGDPAIEARIQQLRTELELMNRRQVLANESGLPGAPAAGLADKTKEDIDSLRSSIEGFGRSTAKVFASYVTNGTASFAKVREAFIAEMIEMAAYKATRALGNAALGFVLDAVGLGASSSLESIASLPAGAPIERRAKGGPAAPFGTYWVGEEGPELLKMGSAGGTVIPARQSAAMADGSGRTMPSVNVSMNVAPGVTRQELLQAGEAIIARAKAEILHSMRHGGAFAG
jgi:tape measure domain-containing protein